MTDTLRFLQEEVERVREIILILRGDVDRARGQLAARDVEIERLRGLLREGAGFPALDSEEREWKERVREILGDDTE